MGRLLMAACVLVVASRPAGAQTQELILPIAINGYIEQPIHFQTVIRVVNLSSSVTEATLEAYQNDGTAVRVLELFPLPRPGTKTVFRIEPLGSVEAFTAGDVPDLDGWIRITHSSTANIQVSAETAVINAPVGPHPICHRPSTEIIASAQLPAVKPATKFSGFAVNRPHRRSGFAVVNPSTSAPATAYLSLFDPSGRFVASGTLQIPGQGRLVGFLEEFLPQTPADFMGSLSISSDIPIGVGALNVLFPEGKFTNLPLESRLPVPCVQVVTPARNPLTSECRNFPTPCDVPEGWQPVDSCG